MKQVSTRQRRIGQLIQEQLTLLIRNETDDVRLHNAVLTSVQVCSDLSTAKVYVSDQCDDIEERLKLLKNAAGFLRRQLASQLDFRTVPALLFVADTSLTYGNKLSQLIEDACQEDAAFNTQKNDDDAQS